MAKVLQVAWNFRTNEYLVLWRDDVLGTIDIFGRRLTSNGVSFGNYISLALHQTYNEFLDNLIYDPLTDSYMAMWRLDNLSASSTSQYSSYVRSIQPDGLVPFSPKLVWSPVGSHRLGSNVLGGYVGIIETENEIWLRFMKPWERLYLPVTVR